jgi:hypothetical protein
LIPNPIRKVLSTMQAHGVRALLMGGQACVLYGAAQFSRDVDLAILAATDNLARLQSALDELQATVVAVPPFEARHLQRGHAVHFRCHHLDAAGLRVDVMSRMRGVDAFELVWERRTTVADETGCEWDLLSLPDLVLAKKTQRDKDWPMIRALVESHYFSNRENPSPEAAAFWLREVRTPDLLVEIAAKHRGLASRFALERPAISAALENNSDEVARLLTEEERRERIVDEAYWKPLKTELEEMRHARLGGDNV